jgi:UDP-GlcNAc:undecaprenyl-phosphate GlcNAc-1-phosphate transferase
MMIPAIIKLCDKLALYDGTGGRKLHCHDVSRLGGVAVVVAFLPVASVVAYPLLPAGVSGPMLASALMMVFLMGLVDDVLGLRARYKLAVQIAAAVLAVYSGITIPAASTVEALKDYAVYIDSALTVLWIIAFVNAVNLIDGIDGLSAGVTIIGLAAFALIGLNSNNLFILMTSLALLGATAGFFINNYPPARIFLGDAGAYSIGFLAAVIFPLSQHGDNSIKVVLVPAIIFLFPFLDVAQVIRKRILLRKMIFSPDKNHIHHRLLLSGYSVQEVLRIVYMKFMIFGCLALLLWELHEFTEILYLLLATGAIAGLLYYRLSAEENKMRKILTIVEPDSEWWLQPLRYYPVEVEIQINGINSVKHNHVCRVTDISAYGAFVECGSAVHEGDRLKLKLTLQGRGSHDLNCRVVWTRPSSSNENGGFGCRFINPGRALRRTINYHLRANQAEVKRRIKEIPESPAAAEESTGAGGIIKDKKIYRVK